MALWARRGLKTPEDGLCGLEGQLKHCGSPQLLPHRLGVDSGRSVGSGAARGRLVQYTPPAVGGPGDSSHRALSHRRVCNALPTAINLYGMTAPDVVNGHVVRPFLKDGGEAPVTLELGRVPQSGVETRQVLQRHGDVADAPQSTGRVEHDAPLSNGPTRAHRVARQTCELAISQGPRGEDVPGFPPQRNGG